MSDEGTPPAGTPPAGTPPVEGTPPAGTPPSGPAGDPTFTIPEAHVSSPWAQGIKSVDDMWSQMAGAQELIGKKGIFLPEQGSENYDIQLKDFRTKMGIPEEHTAYEFKNPEGVTDQRDAEMDGLVKQMMHKHNIPKAAAEALALDFDTLVYEKNKPVMERMQQAEDAFDKIKSELFGDEQDQKIQDFKQKMKDSLGPDTLAGAMIDELDDKGLGVLAAYGALMQKHTTETIAKYTGETQIPAAPGHAGTPQDMKTQWNQLSDQKMALKQNTEINEYSKRAQLKEVTNKMVKLASAAREKGIDLNA